MAAATGSPDLEAVAVPDRQPKVVDRQVLLRFLRRRPTPARGSGACRMRRCTMSVKGDVFGGAGGRRWPLVPQCRPVRIRDAGGLLSALSRPRQKETDFTGADAAIASPGSTPRVAHRQSLLERPHRLEPPPGFQAHVRLPQRNSARCPIAWRPAARSAGCLRLDNSRVRQSGRQARRPTLRACRQPFGGHTPRRRLRAAGGSFQTRSTSRLSISSSDFGAVQCSWFTPNMKSMSPS